MARAAKVYSAKEVLKVLEKPWLNTNDIKIVSSTSVDKARKIKQDIAEKLLKKRYLLPTGLIPTEELIKYLHININFLREMAKNADNN